MHYSESTNNHLTYSEARSLSGCNISARKSLIQHSLPHITQPILSKYRIPKPANQLIIEESTSFWCSLFGKSHSQNLALCRCQRTEENYCELVMKWIDEFYDWKNDPKFVKAYTNYTRRNIEIFLSESQIVNRLQKKLEILGVKIGEKCKNTAIQIKICSSGFAKTT